MAECRRILAALSSAVRKARRAAGQQKVTVAVRPATGSAVLSALLAANAQSPDGALADVVFTYDEIDSLKNGTADVALMCQSTATPPDLELMKLGVEEPIVLLPAGHPLADRPFLTLAEVESLAGYEAQLPHEALDTMVDRVALGQIVVVIGDSVRDRLGTSVRAVPVRGYPATQLVLAWFPDARSAASHLTAVAHAVMEEQQLPGSQNWQTPLAAAEPGRTLRAVTTMHEGHHQVAVRQNPAGPPAA
ncbi:LysR substrate-binding domain-containing protein [Streptomyces phaeochromogenes]|nr:LysR substrate-binding domain-containing protein [Streptomyces phaeochromogenes]